MKRVAEFQRVIWPAARNMHTYELSKLCTWHFMGIFLGLRALGQHPRARQSRGATRAHGGEHAAPFRQDFLAGVAKMSMVGLLPFAWFVVWFLVVWD